MTKKHFIVVAADIKALKDRGLDERALRATALALSDTFKQVNSNFDRERFLTACGF